MADVVVTVGADFSGVSSGLDQIRKELKILEGQGQATAAQIERARATVGPAALGRALGDQETATVRRTGGLTVEDVSRRGRVEALGAYASRRALGDDFNLNKYIKDSVKDSFSNLTFPSQAIRTEYEAQFKKSLRSQFDTIVAGERTAKGGLRDTKTYLDQQSRQLAQELSLQGQFERARTTVLDEDRSSVATGRQFFLDEKNRGKIPGQVQALETALAKGAIDLDDALTGLRELIPRARKLGVVLDKDATAITRAKLDARYEGLKNAVIRSEITLEEKNRQLATLNLAAGPLGKQYRDPSIVTGKGGVQTQLPLISETKAEGGVLARRFKAGEIDSREFRKQFDLVLAEARRLGINMADTANVLISGPFRERFAAIRKAVETHELSHKEAAIAVRKLRDEALALGSRDQYKFSSRSSSIFDPYGKELERLERPSPKAIAASSKLYGPDDPYAEQRAAAAETAAARRDRIKQLEFVGVSSSEQELIADQIRAEAGLRKAILNNAGGTLDATVDRKILDEQLTETVRAEVALRNLTLKDSEQIKRVGRLRLVQSEKEATAYALAQRKLFEQAAGAGTIPASELGAKGRTLRESQTDKAAFLTSAQRTALAEEAIKDEVTANALREQLKGYLTELNNLYNTQLGIVSRSLNLNGAITKEEQELFGLNRFRVQELAEILATEKREKELKKERNRATAAGTAAEQRKAAEAAQPTPRAAVAPGVRPGPYIREVPGLDAQIGGTKLLSSITDRYRQLLSVTTDQTRFGELIAAKYGLWEQNQNVQLALIEEQTGDLTQVSRIQGQIIAGRERVRVASQLEALSLEEQADLQRRYNLEEQQRLRGKDRGERRTSGRFQDVLGGDVGLATQRIEQQLGTKLADAYARGIFTVEEKERLERLSNQGIQGRLSIEQAYNTKRSELLLLSSLQEKVALESLAANRAISAEEQRMAQLTPQSAAALRKQVALDIEGAKLAAQNNALRKAAIAGGPPRGGGGGGGGGLPPAPGGGGSPIDFKRGLFSTIQYGAPSLLLFSGLRAITNTVKAANELQVEFAVIEGQLNSIGEGKAFDSVRQSIFETAKATGQQATEFAKLGRQLVGAFSGLDQNTRLGAANIQKLIPEQVQAAGELAEVVGLPLEEITDGLTAASIAFDKSFREIGDVAVALEEQTGVLGKETVGFIGDIAPVAEEAGFSLEEISSLAAQVQQRSGRSGTTLAEQFGRIIPAVSGAKDELFKLAAAEEALGTPEFLRALSNNQINVVLQQIGASFDKISGTGQQSIVQLLGGRREAGALIPALANIEQFNELVAASESSAGSLDDRFQKVRQTLTNTFERTREAFKLLFVEIYESGLADVFLTAASAVEKLVAVMTPLLSIISKVATLFSGFAGQLLVAVALVKAIQLSMKGIAALQAKIAVTSFASSLGAGLGRNPAVGAQNISQFQAAPTLLGAGIQPGPSSQLITRGAGLAGAGKNLLAVLGGGSAAVGGATVVAAGFLAAYNFVDGKASEWTENIKTIKEEAVESEKTVAQLEKEADTKEADGVGDPGLWERIGAFVTGKDLVTEADALRSAAIQKGLEDTLEIINSYAGDPTLEDIGSKLFPNVGANPRGSISGPLVPEGLEEFELYDDESADIVLAAQAIAENRRQFYDGIYELENSRDSATAQAGTILQQNARLAENAAALLDVGLDELDVNLINALISGSPITALRDLFINEADPQKAAVYERALQAYVDAVTGDPDAAARVAQLEAAFGVSSGQAAQAADNAEAQFEQGIISYATYMRSQRELLTTLEKNAKEVPNDLEAEAAVLEQQAKLSQIVSDRIAAQIDALVTNLDRTNRSDTLGGVNQLLSRVGSELQNENLSPELRKDLLDQYYDLLKQRRDILADQAGSEDEADRIRGEIITVEQEIVKQFAISNLEQLFGDVGSFSEEVFRALNQTFEFAGKLTKDWLTNIINSFASGEIGAEELLNAFAFLAQALIVQAERMEATAAAFPAGQQKDSMLAYAQGLRDQAATLSEANISNLEGAEIAGDAAKDAAEKNKETIFDIRRAQLAVKQAAQYGNDLTDSYFELAEAYIDLEEARDTEEESDDLEALAAILEARKSIAEATRDRARDIEEARAAILSATGNNVEAANEELQTALTDYRIAIERFGAGSPEAEQGRSTVASALINARDSLNSRKEAFVDLLKAQNNFDQDPVEDALIDVRLAEQLLASANGIDEQIAAQQRLVEAQRAAGIAMREVRISQFELRQAELEAIEDEVGAANIAVQIASQQLSDARARGAGVAEINGLQAQLISAQKSANDTRIQEARDNYDFLYEMEQITKQEYISYLESLKSALRPGTDAFRELELTIKRLKDDISGDLQTNLPTALSLPTLYEARRLNQTSGTQGIGYQDNRNMNINVYVDGNVPQEQLVSALSEAVGLGRNGYDTRIY